MSRRTAVGAALLLLPSVVVAQAPSPAPSGGTVEPRGARPTGTVLRIEPAP